LLGEIPEVGRLDHNVHYTRDNETARPIPASFSQTEQVVYVFSKKQASGKGARVLGLVISCDISLGYFACNHKEQYGVRWSNSR
jgi:hypothetical protein